MAPTGRYRPGQLVWVKTRSTRIELAQGFNSTPNREDCEVGLIIRGVADHEIELYGLEPTVMVIFILKREKTLLYEERFIYPIDTFPLEEDD
jgi:hypothetical protein